MWKRFKNWLIKKLGGYTKAEFTRVTTPVLPVREIHHKVRTLTACRPVCAPMSGEPNKAAGFEKMIKDSLTHDILRMVPAYIEFGYREDLFAGGGRGEVRAVLRVTEPGVDQCPE